MTDLYKISVHLAMTSNAPALLSTLAKGLLGLDVQAKKLEGSWKNMLAVGGAFGAAAIVTTFKTLADHGDKLLDQQDRLQRSGVALNDVLKLQSEYYKDISRSVPTSTAAEYLKTVNELRAVTGNTAAAARLAPKAMMVDTLLSNTMGRDVSGEYYKLLRSAEMKGIATDDKKREELTDKAFSYITAFGGKLTANDFQVMARRGGTAWMNADIDKALGPLAVMAADLGGSAAGTTLMTLQQLQLGANTLSKQQGLTLQSLGLLDMSKVHQTGFGGSRFQMDAGAIKGSLEHTGDLPGWIREVVWPAIMKEAGGDRAKAEALIAKISPNRNASKLIEMFGDKGFLDQQQKDLGLAGQVKPIGEAYNDYINRNPKGVKKAFNDQYESMMQAIGAPLMQAAIPVMKSVTDMFSRIGEFANKNPETIANIGKGFAILGAALIGGGGVALLAAIGPAGWLAVGIIALAGAVAVWNPKALQDIATGYSKLWESIKNADLKGILNGVVNVIGQFDIIKSVFHLLPEEIQSWPGRMAEAIEKMGADIVTMLTGIFNGMIDRIGKFLHFTSYMGDGVGGGGFINASYTTGGGGIGGAGSWNGSVLSTSKGWSAGGATPQERAAYIMKTAAEYGIDPKTALRVAQSEGFYNFSGDHGMSHGDFQLYSGGGLGNAFKKATGLNPYDPNNWKEMDMFALKDAAQHGWGAFHGAARVGIGNWQGIDRMHRSVVPPPRNDRQIVLHHHSVLDGKVLSKSITRYQVEAAMMPLGIHGMADDYGSFVGPGTTFQPT